MKLKPLFSKFIHSKLLLYLVFILSVIFFLGNLINSNFDIVVFYVIIAALTSFCTNNMTIVLFIPLFLVFLYSIFIKPTFKYKKEGLENQTPDTTATNLEKMEDLSSSGQPISESQSQPSLPSETISDVPSQGESFKNNEPKKTNSNKKKYNIDYASTVEEAYDNLNNIIGSDGIKNLTGDTQRLMDQQLKLTEAMKNIQPLVETMGPLLEKAGGLLNTMGGSESIGNLANFAKNFSATK